MIAGMEVMNFIARASSAKMVHSNVIQVTVLQHTSAVMVIEIAAICLMKLDVHLNIQEEDTVLKQDSNVITISAFSTPTFVMVLMIVEVKIVKYNLNGLTIN
jgi:hypothetical protein